MAWGGGEGGSEGENHLFLRVPGPKVGEVSSPKEAGPALGQVGNR